MGSSTTGSGSKPVIVGSLVTSRRGAHVADVVEPNGVLGVRAAVVCVHRAGAVKCRHAPPLLHMAQRLHGKEGGLGLYTMTDRAVSLWGRGCFRSVDVVPHGLVPGLAACASVLTTGLLLMLRVQVSRHGGALTTAQSS